MTKGSREAQTLDEHPLVGRTLRGSYRVTRLLDRGGMGLVFEAEHERLRRRLAVKVLPHHLVRDEQALARFQREAEIVALLQHPHVVQVVDFDTTEEQEPYLVMELLSGESLAKRMERSKRLSLDVAVRIASQTASALSAVHQAGIVHRDLKPGNVFLSEMPGEGVWVKLLDFGISKGGHTPQGLTGEHDVMGTAAYMSPEQALGRAAHADQRSDQYSLGVIVYQMLSGRAPFIGRNEIDVLSQVIADPAPTLQLLRPELPERVSNVVRRAMAKLPEDRFDSIEELAAALTQAADVSPAPLTSLAAATLRLTSDPGVLSREPPAQDELSSTRLRSSTPERREPRARQRSEPTSPERTEQPTPSQGPLGRLHSLLGRIERAYAGRDVEHASELVELALSAAETMPETQTKAALGQTSALLTEVLEARIGKLERRLRAISPSSGVTRSLSPQEAFLLSHADGNFTVEELIDSSPLPRLQTLRLIVRLLRGKWLG